MSKINELEYRLSALKADKDELEKQIRALSLQLFELETNEYDQNAPDFIEHKFKLWLKYDIPQTDYPYIQHCISNHLDLFAYDNILHWEKCETLFIEEIATILQKMLEEIQNDNISFGTWRTNVNRADIHTWMEQLIQLDLKSVTMDW